MKFWRSRTVLALILTIAALVVPCASWYIVGMREVRRDAAQIEAGPRRLATDTAIHLVERLEGRLDTLLETESNRPFYHYQSLYHDPKGASEGVSVVPSPLAQGPTDPFIHAYFQVDPVGHVTLPTLPEGELDAVDRQRAIAEQAIQRDLQSAARASVCVASLQQAQPRQLLTKSTPSPQPPAPPLHYEVMESDAWLQNYQASKIYSEIKSGTNLNRAATSQKDSRQKVAIGVGEFQWCSIQTTNGPSLAALRNVITPEGVLVQGFVISNEAIAEFLKNAALPARFLPNASSGAYVVAARLESTGWYIVVSAAKEFDAAHVRVHRSETNFLELFLAGVGAASVAGLCVVVLVWHTEQLARQRSQFAASAAHELRTPLAGLRMYSEMLAEGLGDPTRSRDYAHRVAEEAARLGRVVSNVLGFTRLERGALQVRRAPGDLAAVVRECVERQRPALEAAGAHVEVSISDALPETHFDRDAVAEIIQNLLDNAEKHTRSAGDRAIHITLAAVDESVALSVRDHGPGITADVRRRLFRPFVRGNRNDVPAGLGLGLVLVKALTEAHGGRVTYADAPRGGALFTVTLPR